LGWIWDRLHHGSPDEIADAAGILQWVGLPVEWEPPLSALAETLPDGEPKDVLYDALGHVEAAESVDGLLFHGSTLPFTEPIWYVNVAFDPAAAEAESWAGGLGWSCTRFRQPLSEALSRMEPWAIPSWKAILVGTTGSWTALFSQGSDIYHTDVIGKRLGVRSLRTHFSPHIVRDGNVVTPGDRAFWLNGNGSGHGDRTIQASYQGRWTWGLRGEQQTFEDLGRYAARQVTARFDLDMLDRYCEALGIRRADPDFYTEDCLLIEQDLSRWAHRPSNTLSAAEWRRRRL
jgi:hypothetical protein